jgi:hypothetical protein
MLYSHVESAEEANCRLVPMESGKVMVVVDGIGSSRHGPMNVEDWREPLVLISGRALADCRMIHSSSSFSAFFQYTISPFKA